MPSSVIARMSYDDASQTLTVVFLSGAVYQYHPVPPHVFEGMKSARSKGTYLNQHIKPKYSVTKLA